MSTMTSHDRNPIRTFAGSLILAAGALAIAMACGAPPASAETRIVSVKKVGHLSIRFPRAASISGDGRFVAFEGNAKDLATRETTLGTDIFVRDRAQHTTARLSEGSRLPSQDVRLIAHSDPVISADGRFVAFSSSFEDLVDGDTNRRPDIFVSDRVTRRITRVNVSSAGAQVRGGGSDPTISANGRFVGFASSATHLVRGDTNRTSDIFVRDRVRQRTRRVSVSSTGVQGNNFSMLPSVSANGRFVAFVSIASNLVDGDTNAFDDVFVRDLANGTTTRVSVSSAGAQADGRSDGRPAISADGRFVAFHSSAANLVDGDTNEGIDVFVRDLESGTTTRVSVSSAGAQGDRLRDSGGPSISADGRFVAFTSSAANLVDGDTNGVPDVFVHDRVTGVTTRVNTSSAGVQADRFSSSSGISADGRFVAFESDASNLIDGVVTRPHHVYVTGPLPIPQ